MGRRHQLGVEIDGITYNLLIGNEAEALEQARQRSAAAAAQASANAAAAAAAATSATAAQALPGPDAASGSGAAAAAAAAAGALAPALPTSALAFALEGAASSVGGGGGEAVGLLAPLQMLGGVRGRRALELPETVLMGPLELVLKQPENVRRGEGWREGR